MEDQHEHEDQEHDVYGGEIPDEMDADDLNPEHEQGLDDPNSNSKDLEDMKKRLNEIEEEAGALREMQAKVEKEMGAVQGLSLYNFVRDRMAASEEIEDAPNNTSSPKKMYKDPDDGRQRFLLELEFVQCLANPTYIHYLAQNRYFEDEAFIGYLKYLQYWQQPEYIKFIMYPHCLFFLELLQNANFRNSMAHPSNKELAHRQQFFYWKNYRNNRLKHILPKPLPETVEVPTAAAAPLPPAPPVPAMTAPMTAPPAQAPSPMQYGIHSGPALAKNDMRSNSIDRRKRKFVQ